MSLCTSAFSSTRQHKALPTSYAAVVSLVQRCSLDNHFWTSRISIPTKPKLYNALVSYHLSVRIWMLALLGNNQGRCTQDWCSWSVVLENTAFIKWHQLVRNNEVRRINKQTNFTAIIQSRRLPIFGHIARMDDDDADAKVILMASPPD